MKSATAAVPHDESNDIDLTPMLDVVFIMLIFFVVTASFVKESGIDLNSPDSLARPGPDSASILVSIGASNDIRIEQRLIDPRALRPNIVRMRAERPDANVVILANKLSSNNTLVKVMDAPRAAGVYSIALATNST